MSRALSSLRVRLLLAVVLLAAAGLVLLGAVTYVEQRSFLYGRVDGQARGVGPAIGRALDDRGFGLRGDDRRSVPQLPGGLPARPPAGSPGPPGGRPGGRGDVNLPPGTYGERRSASGVAVGHVTIAYGQATPAAPTIPTVVPVGRVFTVGSRGGPDYRAYASLDPVAGAVTIVAIPLRDVDQTLRRLLLVEALVIAAVLFALAGSALFVVRLGLRPLDRIERTAGEIAAGGLGRRVSPADSRTEVGRLGLALNSMLERLEVAFAERAASEERLRRFLADASHELRTPLASIRGYAELFRMGATGEAGASAGAGAGEGAGASGIDTPQAMRRIEQESARMGLLVDALLTLARLDEEPVPTVAAVDLVALARDAVDDARVVDPARAITITAPAEQMLAGDPGQLRQLLANLLRNALVHTPAGTAIEVLVDEAAAGVVSLRVRDHGAGLPAGADPASLFERFWRAEGERGRERGRAGSGLGLSIVAAVVAAHGGTVSARNAAGGAGAEFEVRLPVERSASALS